MKSQHEHKAVPNFSNWSSREKWVERVLTSDPSWYLICMGTGIQVQLFASNFPYPAHWLYIIGYIFWILDIALFTLFTVLALARVFMFPKVALALLDDIQQTSYLGAVPISWETIGTGIVVFYCPNHEAGVYAAQVFFWSAVAITLLVTCGGIYAIYHRQGEHTLDEVTGALLLTFIPMIVAAAFGSNLANAVSLKNGEGVLVVSFLMLSLGTGMSFLVMGIYVWRLLSCQLPPRDAIVSTFVPVGPPGMAAYAFVNLSVALAQNITKQEFSFRQGWESSLTPSARAAVAESIMWVGVIGSLFLLGVATFFLIEAIAAVVTKVPKTFNIGLWSFVFPCGVYANAFCRLSTLLRNEGMKGWAAFCVVTTVLLWLGCAVMTTYKGVWQGKLFFAPGLPGWVERRQLEELSKEDGLPQGSNRIAVPSSGGSNAHGGSTIRCPHSDGTYASSEDCRSVLGSA